MNNVKIASGIKVTTLVIIVVNFFFFGTELHKKFTIFQKLPVLTLTTSVSFLICLYLLENPTSIRGQILLVIFQILSIFELIFAPFFIGSFLGPSSIPTILFFSAFLLYIHFKDSKTFENKYVCQYAFFILGIIPLLGLVGHLINHEDLLGASNHSPEIGISLLTILLCQLMLLRISIDQINKPTDYLEIKANFIGFKIFYFQIGLSLFLIFFLWRSIGVELYQSIVIGSGVWMTFFLLISKVVIKKVATEKKVTICSWNRTIKSENKDFEEWLTLENFLDEKGFVVSHGISPVAHEMVMLKRNSKK